MTRTNAVAAFSGTVLRLGTDLARRSAMRPWFGGLTWKGVALLTVLCFLNALRRNTNVLDPNGKESFTQWLFGVAQSFGTSMAVALLVAIAVLVTYERVPPRTVLRVPALIFAVLLSSGVGAVLILAFETRALGLNPWGWTDMRGTWPRYVLLGTLLTMVYLYFRRAEESAEGAHRADQERILLRQQMEEAHLLVLQAQIEPHFLFNTLATVRRLYQTDHAAAAEMLDNLMRYLEVALPQMRALDSTLAREIALSAAYLEIQRIRMGRRLTFLVDVDATLSDARMPPMMLLTLVENAIKHGLSPLPEGGFLHVRARVHGQQLRVEVVDSGRGFIPTAGGGTGLANVAARLAGAYGDAAQLIFGPNSPRGVAATIALPYSSSQPSVKPCEAAAG